MVEFKSNNTDNFYNYFNKNLNQDNLSYIRKINKFDNKHNIQTSQYSNSQSKATHEIITAKLLNIQDKKELPNEEILIPETSLIKEKKENFLDFLNNFIDYFNSQEMKNNSSILTITKNNNSSGIKIEKTNYINQSELIENLKNSQCQLQREIEIFKIKEKCYLKVNNFILIYKFLRK